VVWGGSAGMEELVAKWTRFLSPTQGLADATRRSALWMCANPNRKPRDEGDSRAVLNSHSIAIESVICGEELAPARRSKRLNMHCKGGGAQAPRP